MCAPTVARRRKFHPSNGTRAATVKNTERLLGTHHLDTIAARNTLAYAYESAGQLDVAIALFESTAEEHQQLLGSESPWFCRRLGLLDFDQGLAVPLGIVERGFELGRRKVAEVAV